MNAPNDSNLNGILTAIGIIVLLVGTATGNAYVMLAMAIAALVAVAIFARESLSWRACFGMTVAAVMAFALAFGITRF